MKKKNIEKEIEENLNIILVTGTEVNDLYEAYKRSLLKRN